MNTQAEQNITSPWWGDPASGRAGVCPLYAPDTMGEDPEVCTSCFHGPEAHAEAFIGLLETAHFVRQQLTQPGTDPLFQRAWAALNLAIAKAEGVQA